MGFITTSFMPYCEPIEAVLKMLKIGSISHIICLAPISFAQLVSLLQAMGRLSRYVALMSKLDKVEKKVVDFSLPSHFFTLPLHR